MYELVASFMRERLDEIAYKIAISVKAANIQPYAALNLEILVQFIKPTLAADIDYLETADLTPWKNYHFEIMNKQTDIVRPYSAMIQFGKLVGQILGDFAVNELPALGTLADVPSDKVIKNVQRRITNLTAAAISSVTGAWLKQSDNQ